MTRLTLQRNEGKGRKITAARPRKAPLYESNNYRAHSREAWPDSGLRRVRNHSGERKTQKNETPPEGETS